MKQQSPFYIGVWPLLVLPSLLLPLVLFFQWHSIEQKIALNAGAALGEKYSWAKIESFNRGRDLLLMGNPPSEESLTAAQQRIGEAPGVRSVEFGGSIIAETPKNPEFTLEFYSEQIVLKGNLGSQQEIDQAISAGKLKYPDLEIINQLKLGLRNKPITPWSSIISASENLGAGGTISVIGDALTLTGKAKSTEHGAFLEAKMRDAFSGTLVNQTVLVPSKLRCEIKISEALAESKINFDVAKSTISADSDALIKQLAEAVNLCPFKNFEVSGHTDNTGSLKQNLELSELRARSLVDRFVSLGLAKSRFTTKGHGPNSPIASNATDAGRAENRRIEFKITN